MIGRQTGLPSAKSHHGSSAKSHHRQSGYRTKTIAKSLWLQNLDISGAILYLTTKPPHANRAPPPFQLYYGPDENG